MGQNILLTINVHHTLIHSKIKFGGNWSNCLHILKKFDFTNINSTSNKFLKYNRGKDKVYNNK